MLASDYRPLPPCLAHNCGFHDGPPEGAQPPDGFVLPPNFEEMRKKEQAAKARRLPLAEQFQAGSLEVEGLTMPYRLYVPQNLTPGKLYPMVIFFHGAGERGIDNLAQLTAYDAAHVWIWDQQDGGEPCFVLAPQMTGDGWLESPLLAASRIIDTVTDQYPIDPKRLYLTGMSMGGGACWRMNYMFPHRFAAVVPLCPHCGLNMQGKIDPEAIELVADSFVNKPLWLFHAEDDMVVTVETSRQLTAALEQRGMIRGKDFFYTEYPAACRYNHGCWNIAYADKAMRQWLLQQSL